MPPNVLINQLEQIGQMLNRWSAQIRVALWGAVILLGLVVFAFSDIWVRFERAGRLTTWLILVGLAVAAVWQLVRALKRIQTPEAVAARVEQTFPQLDNHLINCLQFSFESAHDPLKAAYVRMPLPYWQGLNFEAMKDQKTFRRALIVLTAAVLLSLIPFPLVGRAWAVAMWRIINPFADVQPVSLTKIVSVTPGDTTIVQGSSAWLTCTVHGKRGHQVWVDIKPADSAQKTYSLGKIQGSGDEVFSNQVYQVTTAMKYRFRAGDAPAPSWYALGTRPPLAFTGIQVRVVPPEYTGARARKYDAQSAAFDIPTGSKVELAVNCNAPCKSLTVSSKEGFELPLSSKANDKVWSGSMLVTNGMAIKVAAVSRDGDTTDAVLPFNLLPDRAPSIEITVPRGEVTLPPGSAPTINFAVADDYGLDEVAIQRVPSQGAKDAPGEVLETFKSKARDFTTLWKGAIRKPSEKEPLILRIVAKDNCPGTPHTVMSSPIVFNAVGVEEMAKQRTELEKKVYADLNKVIDLQRTNIAKTKQYQENLPAATAEQWTDVNSRQKEIRTTTKDLLEKGARCLGNLSDTVKKLYVQEMAEAINLLDRVTVAKSEDKAGLADQTLRVEEKIFRQLTFANMAVAKEKIESRNTALVGMLDGLIREQARIWRVTTQSVTEAKAPTSLTKEQEGEAADTYEFEKACKAEAEAVLGSDKTFSGFLSEIATTCKDSKVREDMLLAADALDKNSFPEAVIKQQSAIAKLHDLRRRFDEAALEADKEKNQQMIDALQNANKKLEKIMALEKKVIESMDAVKEMKDKDKKQADQMEEDFKELEKNLEEAKLEVPKDLNIFADLNVGNDLVDDIATTFEEVSQVEGTDQLGDGPVKELAVAKREAMLDQMEKIKERCDELEYWLKNTPNNQGKTNTEAFDKEEMPNGIALAPLLTKVNDVIGDLLEVSKEKEDAMKGGAINSATPDMEPDGNITEGDVTSFAAEGKSGNEKPQHHEQDGRSNVGREGMSDGETAAASGTISKGDDNIEARRTQDPTQSGQVNADGEAKTKATGGGKLGTGKGDAYGMGGGTRRMDSTEAGSMEAMAALMAKQIDQTYAQASLKGVKSDSLRDAAHYMRQLHDAIVRGAPIDQVAELKRRAMAELKAGKTELEKGSTDMLDTHVTSTLLKDVQQVGPEDAPPSYRPLVSEYFKKLNESL